MAILQALRLPQGLRKNGFVRQIRLHAVSGAAAAGKKHGRQRLGSRKERSKEEYDRIYRRLGSISKRFADKKQKRGCCKTLKMFCNPPGALFKHKSNHKIKQYILFYSAV